MLGLELAVTIRLGSMLQERFIVRFVSRPSGSSTTSRLRSANASASLLIFAASRPACLLIARDLPTMSYNTFRTFSSCLRSTVIADHSASMKRSSNLPSGDEFEVIRFRALACQPKCAANAPSCLFTVHPARPAAPQSAGRLHR